jgi:hypothetical protein
LLEGWHQQSSHHANKFPIAGVMGLINNKQQSFYHHRRDFMEMKNKNIVNLIEELIDLKIRQALLMRDLSNDTTFLQTQQDREAMHKVKLQLTTLLEA